MIKRFFRSLAGKALCVLTGGVLILLLVTWFLGSFAFLRYYEQQKHEVLVSAYHDVCAALDRRQPPDTVMNGYRTEHGMTALVWMHRLTLYSTESYRDPIAPLPAELNLPSNTYTVTSASTHGYTANDLVLYGKSRDGINLALRISMADVQDNAAAATRLWWWIALCVLLVGTAAFTLITYLLARPAKRLSRLADRMAHLDFTDRYTGDGQDELAALGRSLNTVAETMEQSLSELKTANTRLQNDMERTAAQNEARSRFIRNVSHELKTPISLIQTYAEGLHENIAADAADRDFYCSVIEDEAAKLSQVIAKLTTLVQLESGSEELSIERFDILELTGRLLQRHAPLFAERGVAVPTLPDTPCFVWGDGLLIEQVVTNFLTNALHHVSENGHIRIDTTRGDTVTRITVFNTGTGIPDEDLPHIWESFYKIDKARTRAYGGTGIGLSVVAAIMQAHRMPYGVENRPDGVAFYIELQNG